MDVPGRNTAPVEGIDGPASTPKDIGSAQGAARVAALALSVSEAATAAVDRIEALEAALEIATDALDKLGDEACSSGPYGSGCDAHCKYVASGALHAIKDFLASRGMALAVALLVLFAAPSLHAADVAKPAAIYLSLSAADLASTHYATRHDVAREGNGFLASYPVEKQLVMSSAFLGADLLLQSKGKKREAKALRITYAVVRLVAVGINVRNANRGNR